MARRIPGQRNLAQNATQCHTSVTMVEVLQRMMVLLSAVGHQRSCLAVTTEEGRPWTAGLLLVAGPVAGLAAGVPSAVVLPSAAWQPHPTPNWTYLVPQATLCLVEVMLEEGRP